MAARPKVRRARKQPAPRKRSTARARRPAKTSGGLFEVAARHPFMTLGLLVGTGIAVSAMVAKPDPRRVAEAVTPFLALAARRWSDDVVPMARQWRDDIGPAAQARMAEAAAAIPPRRWWESQIEQIRDLVVRHMPSR